MTTSRSVEARNAFINNTQLLSSKLQSQAVGETPLLLLLSLLFHYRKGKEAGMDGGEEPST